MSTNQRDTLRAAIANAKTFQEQVAAVTALSEYDQRQVNASQTARDVDWADTTVRATLSPVAVHERSTIETDWLGEFSADNSPQAHHAAMAEVAMWYGRTSPEVRADREEFGTQAEGFVRRVASAYGEQAGAIYAEGLTYLGFLHRQGASGLDQVQQTVDPHDNPKTTPLNPEVFDNFADEVHPINSGAVGTETSERAPLLQEIEQEGSGQGQPEVPGGHSTGNEATGPSAPFADTVADSGPLGTTSVAINHQYTLEDFLKAQAASGLDQIQQVVDPHEDPKPTPLPEEVAYPWLISPDAYGNGGDAQEKDVEHSASRRPFDREAEAGEARSASLKQADMFGNSDAEHPVVQPNVANTPATTPNQSAGYQDGVQDALAGDQPTYADASSSVPQHVVDYSKGYGDGAEKRRSSPAKDFPVSVGGDNGQAESSSDAMSGASTTASRRSDSFVKAASRQDDDFKKAYAFATKWQPGKPLVSTGSAQFEAGLFAGVVDGMGVASERHHAWRAAHRRQARKDPSFGQRLETHDSYMDHLAEHGIDVTAATTTDLDTMDASTSPSATGETPINGPGTPPPLEGGTDPARAGGPSPYNGAQPTGAPVVPTGTPVPSPGSQYVDDIPGGPLDGNTKALAFRRSVQAGLLAVNKQRVAAQKG